MSQRDQLIVDRVFALESELRTDRDINNSFCDQVARIAAPRRRLYLSQGSLEFRYPQESDYQDLYDMTAANAIMTLANGFRNGLCPKNEEWFLFKPHPMFESRPDIRAWYQMLTDMVRDALTGSNFYSEIHEDFQDLGGFGTSALYVEDRGNRVNFRNLDTGTYAIAENDEGKVDTIIRELVWTAKRIVETFGFENCSENVKEAAKTAPTRRFHLIHAVLPRTTTERMWGGRDTENMPFADIWIEKGKKMLLRNGGFNEFPIIVSRYLKQGEYPYGWSPSYIALPTQNQLNFLEENQDALAEKQAFPPILMPDSLEGDVPETGANGVTWFDGNRPDSVPREWANTNSDYSVGLQRAEQRRQQVREAYHVDAFRIFDNGNMAPSREMTIPELNERASEKLNNLTSAVDRVEDEKIGPILMRVAAIGLRNRWIPAPPKGLITQDGVVPPPRIVYSGRLAMALAVAKNVQLGRHLQTVVLPLSQIKPDVVDGINADQIVRDTGQNLSLPVGWILPQKEIDAIRQARAQQAQMMEQAQAAQQLADAGQKAGLTQQQ